MFCIIDSDKVRLGIFGGRKRAHVMEVVLGEIVGDITREKRVGK